MNRRAAARTVAGTIAALAATVGLLVAAACPAGAESAAPDPSTFTATSYRVITGDLTGDGAPDRIVLGEFASNAAFPTCGVQIRAGRPGTTTTVVLPVQIDDDADFGVCPDSARS